MTYASLAAAFNSPLVLHEETAARMRTITSEHADAQPFDWDTPSAALTARLRMATLPSGPGTKVIFVAPDLWVPISIVNCNIHVLPGIPRIFVQLLEGLRDVLLAEGRVDKSRKAIRVLISSPLPESDVAEYLTRLQGRVAERGVKIGSYPKWGKKMNTITLVGNDTEFVESLVEEVERETKGSRVTAEGDTAAEDENSAEAMADAEAQKAGGKEAKEKQAALVDGVEALKVQ